MSVFTRRTLLTAASTLVAASTLAACGGEKEKGGPKADANGITTINVGATPKPHAEILKFIQDNLAKDAGLDIVITEYTDYQIPNQALKDGDIDANYYQTIPFLEEQKKAKGYKFVALAPVHVEPLGLYSKKFKNVADLPEGGEIAIPNDPTNRGRAIALLVANKLVGVTEGVDPRSAKVADVTVNPKNFKITEVDAPLIPRALGDFAAGVINGNYAIEAGLNPAKDSLVLESAENNPNANLLVVREGDENNPAIQKLEKLLHSEQVKKFINDNYEGAVIPAF
ncbi:MetQ/NlpA family ABC transporter substrate-binding protein [Dermabacteraceae bacterium TAE3-ERU27]|nr:MetQ/NlpA family ABC transporter substrate-binding protein [Dermabacteraceae bacterium TAE3-ERU27]